MKAYLKARWTIISYYMFKKWYYRFMNNVINPKYRSIKIENDKEES